MLVYALALASVVALAALSGSRAASLCALIVGGNFLANEAFVRATGIHDAWAFFACTDAIAAYLLCRLPCGSLGGLVAGSYATQIIMHWAYVMTGEDETYRYWEALTFIAWFQLALILGGAIHAGLRRARQRRVFRAALSPDLSHHREAEPADERGDGR